MFFLVLLSWCDVVMPLCGLVSLLCGLIITCCGFRLFVFLASLLSLIPHSLSRTG